MSKFQETSNILRVDFALSKWPHFNSVYLVRVPFLTGIAVNHYEIKLTKFKQVFMSKRGREAWKNMGHRVKSWGFFTLVFLESFSSHYDELLTWLLLSALFGPTWLESRGLVKKSESYIFFPLVNIRHCMRL